MTVSGLSITDFLTDGSLAALCDAVSGVTGTPIRLRDPQGRVIVSRSADATPWALEGDGGVAVLDDGDAFSAPLALSSGLIGTLAIPASTGPAVPEAARSGVERFLTLLASIVSEICERELQLRHRVEELEVLRRLSGLLVGASDTNALLDVAIRSAVEMLDADAGAVRVLDDAGQKLHLRAWSGLSRDYVAEAKVVDAGDVPDTAALEGQVVVVEDLFRDRSSPHAELRVREGLASMISAGMVFRGKALGVMRLFSRNPRKYTSSERALFKAIAEQSAAALASTRLLETEREHLIVQRQVRIAADVQRRMLPPVAPRFERVQIAARAIPSYDLSGDFYDFIELPGNLGIVVGDVAGKGVAAALLMAAVRAFLRAYAQDVYHLDEAVARVNRALVRDTLDNEFATLFYGVIDPATLRMTYCNAGHEAPLLVRPGPSGTHEIIELDVGGMVVGVDATQKYDRGIIDLRPGDTLLAYTDGLSDSMNFDGHKFGKPRVRAALEEVLRLDPNAPAERVADHVLWENRRFVGLNRRTDDTTIVVLRVTR
ncbi:MAG: PP2C family protein-serine/threonine phosphatase [Phycisphaerales bacterium]